MNIPKLSVKNPVLVNMITVIVFILGMFVINSMPKEDMPAIEMGKFVITVVYPGVSPEEIEKLVVNKIEDELSDLSDIDYISSTAYEGVGTIIVNLLPSADIDQAWSDVNAELDKVKDLPEDANDPTIQNISIRDMKSVCTVSISGDYDDNSMRELADDLKDDLNRIDFISKVEVKGAREREIHLKADRYAMEKHGISFNQISSAVTGRNLNVPAGDVKAGDEEYIIRTMGEFEQVSELEFIPLKADKFGNIIRLRDVAEVFDTLEDEDVITKIDGKKSVNLYLYQTSDGNILSIMDNVKQYLNGAKKRYSGIEMRIINDESIEVKSNISTLSSSALLGIVLVFICLFIFIGWRNALLAAVGIPFTFLITFIAMDYLGLTINNLSLFALVLVLGMLVDDAIVVIENVYRHLERGMAPKEAAVKGTTEIMWPVIAAILTTISAFMPLLMMEGNMGKFLSTFPKVISITLLASLFEALFILPSHLADFSKQKKVENVNKSAAEEHKILGAMLRVYRRILKALLRHRIITVFVIVIALVLSGSAIVFKLIKFNFFPKTSAKTLVMQVELAKGTSLEATTQLSEEIEKYLLKLEEKSDIESINTNIGSMQVGRRWEEGTNYLEMRIDLLDADIRTYDQEVIKSKVRKYLSRKPEISSYKFSEESHGPPAGNDVELRLLGDDLDKLETLTSQIKAVLQTIPGVKDIDDDLAAGKKEIKMIPDYDKLAIYGLTVSEVAYYVKVATRGATVSKFRKGGEEYDIILSYKDNQVDEVKDLENLKIRSNTGTVIALKEILNFKIESGLSEINHRAGQRQVSIEATCATYFDQNKGKNVMQTSDEVNTLLFGDKINGVVGKLENFNANNPGFTLEVGGRSEERAKSFGSLYVAFLVAILLIYAILGTQFKSYVQPIIVMITIPFAFIGVIFGLLVTGESFSLLSLISVVALAGIVVNDSLVLVDFVNKEREMGVDRWNSLINAGCTRMRPILLTTATTIFGFMPMLLSQSESITMWKPMAVSITFGLGFATVLTLLVIPVIYSLIDSCFGCFGMTRFKKHIGFEEAMKNYQYDD